MDPMGIVIYVCDCMFIHWCISKSGKNLQDITQFILFRTRPQPPVSSAETAEPGFNKSIEQKTDPWEGLG